MEKIYFLNTYENYHANGSNRSYWSKFFKNLERELNETNKLRLYSSFNENMPIYEFYSEAKGRFVRIMQYNPKNEIVESERYTASRFYTAWIDKRTLIIKKEKRTVERPELVVCLLMTAGNIEKAGRLIRSWLLGVDDSRVREEIERIYAEQERIDEEKR